MALVATRKERKGKMGMDQGENPSVLWFVSFSIISTMFCGQFFPLASHLNAMSRLRLLVVDPIVVVNLSTLENANSQDLVAAKRRVSIFDKLRRNSKGVRIQRKATFSFYPTLGPLDGLIWDWSRNDQGVNATKYQVKVVLPIGIKISIVHSVIKHPGPDSSFKRRDSNDEHWKDQLKDQKGPSYQSINQAMRCLYM